MEHGVNHAEKVARAVVEAVERDSRMIPQPVQSQGEFDFVLVRPGRAEAALEVTASADESAERTVAALLDKKKGGPAIKAQRCKRDWLVYPGSGVKVNELRKSVDVYLADVEAEGLDQFFSPTDAVEHLSVDRIWRDLQVLSAYVVKWKDPGWIRVSPPGGGGAVAIEAFSDAVLAEGYEGGQSAEAPSVRTRGKAPLRLHPSSQLPAVGGVPRVRAAFRAVGPAIRDHTRVGSGGDAVLQRVRRVAHHPRRAVEKLRSAQAHLAPSGLRTQLGRDAAEQWIGA